MGWPPGSRTALQVAIIHVYVNPETHVPHLEQLLTVSLAMSDHISRQGSLVIRALDRLDRTLTAASPIAVTVIGISSMYYVAFSYGLAVIGLLCGRECVTQVSPSTCVTHPPLHPPFMAQYILGIYAHYR